MPPCAEERRIRAVAIAKHYLSFVVSIALLSIWRTTDSCTM